MDGTGRTSNETDGTWTVTFPYGNISGISTCNSTKAGNWGTAYPQYSFDTGTTGKYCWCRMTSPTRSAWVYDVDRGTASACDSICAFTCASRVETNEDFRSHIIGAAGQ